MRTSQLQNMSFNEGGVVQHQSPMYNPMAKEHAPHVSASNKLAEHITAAHGKKGKLGAKSHGGN